MSHSPVRRRQRADLVRLTIFLVVAGLFTFWVGAVTGEYRAGDRDQYSAVFEDVSGLQVGDKVRIAGVEVGKVRNIVVQEGSLVLVTFDVDPGQVLDTSIRAAIQYRNLIGDRVVSLSRTDPDARTMAVGDTIPVEQTASALDLDTLLNGFKPLFAGLSPSQINALSGDLVQVLQGQRSAVTTLVQHVGSFTTTIAEREQLVGQVIRNLNDVVGTFDERRDTVAALIDSFEALVTGLDRQDTQILDAAQQIDALARDASSLVRAARGGLKPDLVALATAARGLNGSADTLEQVLHQLPRHYRAIQNTASYGNFFNFFLCGVQVQTGGPDGGTVLSPWIYSDVKRCKR